MTPAAVVFLVLAGATHNASWINARSMQVTLTRQDLESFRALSTLVREQRAQGKPLLDVRASFSVVLCSPEEELEEAEVKVLEASLPEDALQRTEGGKVVIDERFVEFVARDGDDVEWATVLIDLNTLEGLFAAEPGLVALFDQACASVPLPFHWPFTLDITQADIAESAAAKRRGWNLAEHGPVARALHRATGLWVRVYQREGVDDLEAVLTVPAGAVDGGAAEVRIYLEGAALAAERAARRGRKVEPFRQQVCDVCC